LSGLSSLEPSRQDRWQNLLATAMSLEANASDPAAVRRLLDSVLEVFPASLDPVDDFEGFAVRRLAQAFRQALPPL
jgi:hypothetical protein